MRDFLELPNNPTIFSEQCDVSTGKFHPHILSDEAISVQHSCDNPYRKNIITCKDEYLDEFIDEVGGLDLNTKLSTNLQDLPNYIPVFDKASSKIPNLDNSFPVVALSLIDILSNGIKYKAGGIHIAGNINIKESTLKADCFHNKRTILFCTGSDTLIEEIWHQRKNIKFFETIKDIGFHAVGGFNFSLITGECALSQALNQKRSLYSAFLAEQTGSLSIPHIYALSHFHVDRWIEWLKKNPNIRYFTINCQLQSITKDIPLVIQTVKKIIDAVPYIKVLLQGFPFSQIENFNKYINNISFADSLPVKLALSRIITRYNYQLHKWERFYNPVLPVPELVKYNIIQRKLYIDNLKNKAFKHDNSQNSSISILTHKTKFLNKNSN